MAMASAENLRISVRVAAGSHLDCEYGHSSRQQPMGKDNLGECKRHVAIYSLAVAVFVIGGSIGFLMFGPLLAQQARAASEASSHGGSLGKYMAFAPVTPAATLVTPVAFNLDSPNQPIGKFSVIGKNAAMRFPSVSKGHRRHEQRDPIHFQVNDEFARHERENYEMKGALKRYWSKTRRAWESRVQSEMVLRAEARQASKYGYVMFGFAGLFVAAALTRIAITARERTTLPQSERVTTGQHHVGSRSGLRSGIVMMNENGDKETLQEKKEESAAGEVGEDGRGASKKVADAMQPSEPSSVGEYLLPYAAMTCGALLLAAAAFALLVLKG